MRKSPSERFLVFLIVLLSCPALCSAQERVLSVGGDQLRFTPQPEQGYVVKLGDKSGHLGTLTAVSALDAKNARSIHSPDSHGIWTVENADSAGKNDETIKRLKNHDSVVYIAPLFSSNGQTVAIIPEIVVRLAPGIGVEPLEALCGKLGLRVKKQMAFTDQEYLLEVLGADADAVFEAVHELDRAPFVEWAAPNTASRPRPCDQIIPNDVQFPQQWHLHNTGQTGGTLDADINASEAWEITTGDPNIVVAVLDTGVDSNQPDLRDNLVAGYDFHEDDDSPEPGTLAHGTRVAGVIAAQGNNHYGVAGVTWKCSIMPIRTYIWGDWGMTPESEVATAFRWAATHGADVFNNSWAENIPIPIVHSAIIDVTAPGGIGRDGKGCVVLVASGNESGAIRWPAKYPEVIAVGATTSHDTHTGWSNYGPELDLAAPGSGIRTTDITYPDSDIDPGNPDYYCSFSGTSAACPVAAGAAALILSIDPNLTNVDVQLILQRSARDLGEPGWDEYYGYGRVDARAALEMVLNRPGCLYVDDNAPSDPGPGDPEISDPNEDGSARHPFDTVQEAIDNALATETIVLLPGRYVGVGNRNINFGGKAITVRSERGPETCIIDCQGLGRGFSFDNGEGPDSMLEGLTITGGRSQEGAGIFLQDSSPTIQGCLLVGNTASLTGAGICILGEGNPLIAHCVMAENTAFIGGSGLQVELGNPTLVGCTLARNVTTTDGAGIFTPPNNPSTLTDCILWDNTPGQILGSATVSFSDVQGGRDGEGNLDVDPLFADPENGDYHLKSETGRWDPNSGSWVRDDVTSPCIDAGDPSSDFSGEVWPHGGRINMGAYGGTAQASMSVEPVEMFLPRIACIHWDDSRKTESFQSFLKAHGCSVTLIRSDRVAEHPLDGYDLIMIATDTPSPAVWEDDQLVAALTDTGQPIIGLGEGGYRFFGRLGLTIGYPNGASGTFDSVQVLDPNSALFNAPYPVTVPGDGVLQLYGDVVGGAMIYLWPAPPTVTTLGSMVGDSGYFPLLAERGHLLWGFAESPAQMTEIGKRLFLNAVILTANAKLEPQTAPTP